MFHGWKGVLPAVTTQFNPDYSLNTTATGDVMANILADGVDGLVLTGTVGEGTALSHDEKRAVVETAVAVADGQAPVIVGIADFTTDGACKLSQMAEHAGADALMVLPAMVYPAKPFEIFAHFETVAKATSLPIMVYNNPPSYRVDVTADMMAELAKIPNIEAIKESSGDTRRLVDVRNACGDAVTLLCGLDDVVMESVAVGAIGWVSGMSNVFPHEAKKLFEMCAAGQFAEARPLYDWFMPLLHLDARPDLVQCIKLCEEIMGRGSALTRPPRLPLTPEERAAVEDIMETALNTRPEV